jgi:hypothetical protein
LQHDVWLVPHAIKRKKSVGDPRSNHWENIVDHKARNNGTPNALLIGSGMRAYCTPSGPTSSNALLTETGTSRTCLRGPRSAAG